jgi:MFS family permease
MRRDRSRVVGLSGSLAGLFVGTAVFASGQAFAFPALMALAVGRTSQAERSAAVGTVAAAAQAAMGTGAIALGAVIAVAAYRTMFLCGAAAAVLGLAVLRGLCSFGHRRTA